MRTVFFGTGGLVEAILFRHIAQSLEWVPLSILFLLLLILLFLHLLFRLLLLLVLIIFLIFRLLVLRLVLVFEWLELELVAFLVKLLLLLNLGCLMLGLQLSQLCFALIFHLMSLLLLNSMLTFWSRLRTFALWLFRLLCCVLSSFIKLPCNLLAALYQPIKHPTLVFACFSWRVFFTFCFRCLEHTRQEAGIILLARIVARVVSC